MEFSGFVKADSHVACRAHAVPLPCRAAKRLQCVFPIWFTQCGRVWFTLAMACPCHALTMPFFSRPRHSTVVEWRPVGYLPVFGFFRLPHRVPRRFLSEAYQSSSQWSIPMTVKSGSSTLQKDDMLNCWTISAYYCKPEIHWGLLLWQFVLLRFTFTNLVQSDRALPTCGASLSQLKRPFST